jgi:hypothetical protein
MPEVCMIFVMLYGHHALKSIRYEDFVDIYEDIYKNLMYFVKTFRLHIGNKTSFNTGGSLCTSLIYKDFFKSARQDSSERPHA